MLAEKLSPIELGSFILWSMVAGVPGGTGCGSEQARLQVTLTPDTLPADGRATARTTVSLEGHEGAILLSTSRGTFQDSGAERTVVNAVAGQATATLVACDGSADPSCPGNASIVAQAGEAIGYGIATMGVERSPDGGSPDGGAPTALTWAQIETQVLSGCGGNQCHGTGNTNSNVVLDDPDVHARMLSQPSTQVPTMRFLEPGVPAESYLYRKLEGTQSQACTDAGMNRVRCGGRMPLSATAIAASDLEGLRLWIEQGAAAN